jgi:hypothetical protein
MEKDTNPKDAIGTAKWRQFFVVPMQVLWEVGVGMLEGTLKYGRHNYRGAGVRASVYVDAALGHIQSWVEGEDIDKDSDLSHITKAICSLFVLRDAMMNDMWTDDRPPKIKDLDALRDRLQGIVARNFERYVDKDPHHYSEVEDGSPYNADGYVTQAEARKYFETFGNGQMSPEDGFNQELDAIFATILANGGRATINRIGDIAVTEIEMDPGLNEKDEVSKIMEGLIARDAATDPIQNAVDHARGSNEPPEQRIVFSTTRGGPSLASCAAHLEDPLYWPRDPLACLSDDDPEQILWLAPEHPDFDAAHIVEGLTSKQMHRLVTCEALFCGRSPVEFETLARRVLLGIKSNPRREVVLLFPSGGHSDRHTRLTKEQWQVAVPGVIVTEKPYHGLLRPAEGVKGEGISPNAPRNGFKQSKFVPRGFA